jgi:hypothetical protein
VSQLQLAGCTDIVLPPDWEDGRGSWCTPRVYAEAVGAFDLDPFTNTRSHVKARHTCILERGDDGFGDGSPGSFFVKGGIGYGLAAASTRVWIQPPYDIVLRAIRHYGHTRFTALLRLDPSTQWFAELYALSEVILVPVGDRIEFDPPPGVKSSSNPFPHGFFYANAKDVTPAMRERCLAWPTNHPRKGREE